MMRLVRHNRPGQPYEAVGVLDAATERGLKALRAGTLADPAARAETKRHVGAVLAECHRRDCWLVCDCRRWDPANRALAILTPQRLNDGSVLPRRLWARGTHAKGCVLKRAAEPDGETPDDSEAHDDDGGAPRTPRCSKPRRPDFLMRRGRQTGGEPVAAIGPADSPAWAVGQDEAEQGASRDPLAPRLCWLMRGAGLNRMDGASPRGRHALLERLRQAAQGEWLVPGELRLSDILFVCDEQGAVAAKDALWNLLQARRDHWPAQGAPQAYLLAVVERLPEARDHEGPYEGKWVFRPRGGGTIRVSSLARRRTFGGEGVPGAHLVLVWVRLRTEPNPPEPVEVRAYAYPVLSTTQLFPVDSEPERQAARVLAAQRCALIEKDARLRNLLAIEKPLFALGPEGVGGPGCLPDFLVWAGPSACAVIETMGSTDQTYRARKQRMHEIMRRCGDRFIVDERAWCDRKTADEALARAVEDWVCRVIGRESGRPAPTPPDEPPSDPEKVNAC